MMISDLGGKMKNKEREKTWSLVGKWGFGEIFQYLGFLRNHHSRSTTPSNPIRLFHRQSLAPLPPFGTSANFCTPNILISQD